MPVLRLAVAASGGRDSTALLHCTARAAAQLAITCGVSVHVHALHVHHGLHVHADAWLDHVAAQVKRWARNGLPLTFHHHRLLTAPQQGESVEAWARRERYAALEKMANELGCDTVLLAHHRRDQAETVLLQALRGAGPAGLAAMPKAALRDGIQWLRPWLNQSRDAIDVYLKRWQLGYIEDPSNVNARFARSRLRKGSWLRLVDDFPDAELAFAAVAAHAHEAAECLRDIARLDLERCAQGPTLLIDPWLELGSSRRANSLRTWLTETRVGPVPESLVKRLLAELPGKASGRWPFHSAELRLHQSNLSVGLDALPTRNSVMPVACCVDLSWPGVVSVSEWRGHFVVEETHGPGLDASALTASVCRARAGGEQFQATSKSVPQRLKNHFQRLGLPAWCRTGPLVFANGKLVFVPGLGMDARAQSLTASRRVTLTWCPDPIAVNLDEVSSG